MSYHNIDYATESYAACFFFLSAGRLKALLTPPFIAFQRPMSTFWFQVSRPTHGWTL